MKFAVYENMNATYVDMEAGRPREQTQMPSVALVILDAPEGTSQEDVVQRLFAAGVKIGENGEIRSESEWPEEVRRQVNARDANPNIRHQWAAIR